MAPLPELCRARQLLICALLSGILGGCLPLYLHKDSYEKETADVQKAVNALDVEAGYKILIADAKEIADKEDSAAADAVIATRNADLVGLIEPFPGELSDARVNGAATRFHSIIQADISALTNGKTTLLADVPGTISAKHLESVFAKANERESAVAQFIQGLRSIYAIKTAHQGDIEIPAWTCEDAKVAKANASSMVLPLQILAPESATDRDNETAAEFQARLERNKASLSLHCQERREAWGERAEFLRRLGAEDKLPDSAGSIPRSAADLYAKLAQRQTFIRDAEKTRADLEKLLSSVLKKNDKSAIQNAIERFKKTVPEVNALAQAAGWKTLLTYTQCGLGAELLAFSASDEKGSDAAGDSSARTDAVNAVANTEKPVEGADKNKLTTIACEAGKSGIQVGKDGEANPLILDVARAIIGVERDAKILGLLERLNAEIMAIAELRQRADIAEAQARFGGINIQLLKARLHALLEQIRLDKVAAEELGKLEPIEHPGTQTDRTSLTDFKASSQHYYRVVAALTAYAQSWDSGRIPVVLLNYRVIQAQRNLDIDIATLTAKNYKELLKPIVDALAAYGAGGIPAELLGQILGNAAIITGIGTF
ncbi:hypothetical protein [Dongia rigui]|uniref:Uncharacterized protein n=1 Tax=Dongia rigui TaxID=940149 RepID=A0ABU5E554_9PROT|nr:hypothetical protein [Dongia rigui]MDY0874355.1 hypothetical protein [Dongia rigui]